MNDEESPRYTLGQRLALAVVPRMVWALVRVLGLTWRFEVIAAEGVTPLIGGMGAGAEIFCFWHQCVLPCTVYYRSTHATILISRSFDGELVTRVLGLFGFRAVRGSSSRGAREGLLGLANVIENGRPAIFTADGPRGPRYQTKMGPIKLAQMHRRAYWRFSPGAGAGMDDALLGPVSGAEALYANRGELGTMDACSRRSARGAV